MEERESDVLSRWQHVKGEEMILADIWFQERGWGEIFGVDTSYIGIALNSLSLWVIGSITIW